MNRIILILASLIFCSLSVNAQFGMRATYNLNNAPAWDNFFSEVRGENQSVFDNSLTFTLDYWLRLPNHRIEFYPNVSFHQAKTTFPTRGPSGADIKAKLRQIGIGITSHIYLLDLVGDCDCPTFSKQGGFFKKGFFVLAGVGADYSEKDIALTGLRDGNVDFKASLGLGIDIGVTDLITVSPFVQYQYYPAISWHELGPVFNRPDTNVETTFSQIQAGIRIGLRPDYKAF